MNALWVIGEIRKKTTDQLVRRVDYSQRACVATVMGLLFCCPKRDKKEPK
jgi:hypothetical protein